MPDGSVPLLIALIALVLLSGFFSAAETAFSCASKIKLRALAANGNKRAEKTLDLAENKFDKLLSTILVGNNIVNITTATLGTFFFVKILDGTNADPALISTVAITAAVLLFGEITPKFIASAYPEKFAMTFYPLTVFFFWIFYGFNFIFGGWKWVIAKIFRLKGNDKVTEEEILTVVEEAEEDGTIRKDETRLIRSVIEFDDVEVGDILVPRVNIVAVDVNSSMEDVKKVFDKEGYSRLPVYKDSIDTIIGTIHEKDFFSAYLSGVKKIKDVMQPAVFTTEHIKISNLLKQLQKKKVHIAVVLDEYGGTAGIITLEDVLEELVGEIWDEHDEEINYFKKSGDATLVDGNAPLSDFFAYFELCGEEEKFDTITLSGWIIERVGEIPKTGFKFDYLNLEIEILKATVKRILQVKVSVKPDAEE
ncbi:MAG: HlyC/CorC family transporter [Clostridia bacterium]|nr:HlyC/CorC family transporter [Clostridia bacterium]